MFFSSVSIFTNFVFGLEQEVAFTYKLIVDGLSDINEVLAALEDELKHYFIEGGAFTEPMIGLHGEFSRAFSFNDISQDPTPSHAALHEC